ncbi:MAG: RsmB/NOP family class I SAM-dependent RNA methyltransferase [Pseudomonadota bacterium]
MTPGARVQAAIEVIDLWTARGPDGPGLDRVLADWGRRSRFAGSGDRRAVADHVYGAVRRLRSALWQAGAGAVEHPPTHTAPPGRLAMIGSLRLDRTDPVTVFTGLGHAPAPLSEAELVALQPGGLDDAPRGVWLDVPDWLLAEGHLGSLPIPALERLRHRAPLHLRTNTLRATREVARDVLAAEGIETIAGPLSPTCLTVMTGDRRLASATAYSDGLVEIQDAASQAVADLAEARPGMRILDLCAGAGGKTLAMAAMAENASDIVAHDIDPARLAQLAPRAIRAGAKIRAEPDAEALPCDNDLVVVDAPCSGSGAWARNPDAKWRLTPARLTELTQLQSDLLDRASRFVRPGGRILYATCSLISLENARIVDSFLAKAHAFTLTSTHHWTPLDGGDGFFAACFTASS